MTTSDVIHVFLLLGFGAIAVVLPGYILRFRRTLATYALCGMIWCVFAAGALAVANDLQGHARFDYLDALRIGAVGCFMIFMLAYNRGEPGDGPARRFDGFMRRRR